jgi:hypothetical protein
MLRADPGRQVNRQARGSDSKAKKLQFYSVLYTKACKLRYKHGREGESMGMMILNFTVRVHDVDGRSRRGGAGRLGNGVWLFQKAPRPGEPR